MAQMSLGPEGAPVLSDLAEGKILRLLPDGAVDVGFGDGGEVLLRPTIANEGDSSRTFSASDVAVDGSGRVVIFGSQTDVARSVPVSRAPGTTPSSEGLILRLDLSGNLDSTFGEGKGFVRTDFGLKSRLSTTVPLVQIMAGTVDSQGRPVLVAGTAAVAAACVGKGGIEEVPRKVVRLTTSGSLDPGFGSTSIGGTQSASLLIAGEDELAVGTGPIGGGRPECRQGGTVYRIRPTGGLLTEFGKAGVRSFKGFHLAALEPSGGVVVDRLQGHTLTLKRLSSAGTVVPGFGHGGEVKVRLPERAGLQVSSVLVDEQGRILVTAFVEGRPGKHRRAAFTLARVSADGRLERGFGEDGWVTTAFPRSFVLTSARAKLDAQGRLIVAGMAVKSGDPGGGFLVARYLLSP